MKPARPAKVLKREGQAPVFCENAHNVEKPYDRKCHLLDGRPKRWYLVRGNAKNAARKNNSVYLCPKGTGFHIGR